jgi:hypothetical protein
LNGRGETSDWRCWESGVVRGDKRSHGADRNGGKRGRRSGWPFPRALGKGVEVGGQETDSGYVTTAGFAAAEQNDWFAGDDPLRDFVNWHSEQVGDRPIKEIAIGGQDFGFVLI